MTQHEQRDTASESEKTHDDARAGRIDLVVLDHLQRRHSGEDVSDAAIIAEHQELMPELAERLREIAELSRQRNEASAAGDDDCSSGLDPRALRIRCPHCRQSTEVLSDADFDHITCAACGSQFSLARETVESREAPSYKRIAQFELIERLGLGSFGTVWKARDTELDRTVAVKIPRRGQLGPGEIEKFLREARTAAQLNHKNVARVYEIGREGDTVYIVNELIRGVSLADWLTAKQPTFQQAAELCAKIAEALHYAHESGVVHRDLKPANIMLDDNDEPYLMDFGLAKREAGAVTMTLDGHILGTPAYMSPEQARGEAHHADRRTDVYALGVILFELLTGELPFRGNARMLLHQVLHDEAPSPRKLNSSIPKDLETICLKCLEKEPVKRYGSARELAEEFHRFVRDEPIRARPISNGQRVLRWCRRKPIVATLALVFLALAVAAPIIAVSQTRLRMAADRATASASMAQQRTQRALSDAEKQRQRVEYGNYVSRIRLAAANLERGNGMVARQELNSAPTDYRNWEWGYLVASAWPPQIKAHRNDNKMPVLHPDLTVAEYWAATAPGLIGRYDPGRHARISASGFSNSNDITLLAVGMIDGSLHVWNPLASEQPVSLPKLGSGVMEAVFSHEDSWLAVGEVGGALSLFAPDTKGRLWTREALSIRPIRGVWFSPDDARLAVADSGGGVNVVDTSSGRTIHTFTEHPDQVQSLHFLRDGNVVLSASRDGSIRNWELETGRQIQPSKAMPAHSNLAASIVKISPNHHEVAVGYVDGSIILWNQEINEKRDLFQANRQINDLVFSPDGTCLFIAEGGRVVRVVEMTGKQISVLHSSMQPDAAILVSLDGTRVATSSTDGIVNVWAPLLHHTDERRKLTTAHDDLVLQAAFSSSGARIVTASYDKIARVWDAVTQELGTEFTGHHHELLKAEFSPDGKWIASIDCRGTVKVWNAETGEESFSFTGDAEAFFSAATSERGLRGEITRFSAVFSASPFFEKGLIVNDRREMVVIDYTNGRRLLTLKGCSPIGWPVICPRGKHVAMITDTLKETHLWDVSTGDKLHTLVGHTRQAYWAEFSPDGLRLVTGSMDGTAIVWDVLTGKPLFTLDHGANVMTARFGPNGKRIATASAAGTAKIWDATTGQVLSTFDDHTDRLSNVEFSPDGTRVLTTAIDNTIRVWDPQKSDARELVQFTRDAKLVYGTWSPDGRQILTCWGDGTVHLLEACPWKESTNDVVPMDERVRQWRAEF